MQFLLHLRITLYLLFEFHHITHMLFHQTITYHTKLLTFPLVSHCTHVVPPKSYYFCHTSSSYFLSSITLYTCYSVQELLCTIPTVLTFGVPSHCTHIVSPTSYYITTQYNRHLQDLSTLIYKVKKNLVPSYVFSIFTRKTIAITLEIVILKRHDLTLYAMVNIL